MSIALPVAIFNLPGQVVKKIDFDQAAHQLIFLCRRDKRRKATDPVTGQSGTINRYVRRRAKHPLTTARIEAGNVGIGLIRKRARGIRDTEYFKLKIRQLRTPENAPIFYKAAA